MAAAKVPPEATIAPAAASVFSGVPVALGTLASYPFVSRIDQPLLGLLLALSAGALIHVGAAHLLPRAEGEPRRVSLIALAAGVFLALGIVPTKG